MLSHEEPTPLETVPFAERRITPHELTRALSSIEAHREEDARRQEEEQRYFASTLTVGEAVSTLSLDVTPDQLWAEVEILREADRCELPGPPSEPSNYFFEKAAHEAEAWERTPDPMPDQGTRFRIYRPQPAEELAEAASPLSPRPMTWAEQVTGETDWNGGKSAENTEQEDLRISKGNNSLRTVFSLIGGGLAILCLLSWFAVLNSSTGIHPRFYSGQPGISLLGRAPRSNQNMRYDFNAHLRDVTPEFYRKLKQTIGPNAPLRLIAYDANWDLGPINRVDDVYPLNAVPDGYVFYMTSDGAPFGLRQGSMGQMAVVAFQNITLPADAHEFFRDRGEYRLRGWVKAADLPGIACGMAFRFASCVPPGSSDRWVPFTQPQGIQGKSINGFYPDVRGSHGYSNVQETQYPSGRSLDTHALMAEPSPQEATNIPPRLRGSFHFGAISGYYSAGFDASSVLKLLSEVPDKKPIYDTSRLAGEQSMLAGEPLQVDIRPGLHKPWKYVKYDGHLYICGWIATRVTQTRLDGQNLKICNSPDNPVLGMTPTPVTLRVDQFHCNGWGGGNARSQTLFVRDVKLDSHAYEKWTP